MSHDDFEFEPVRGLPALLPEGERLLWQGAPRWSSLAIRGYHVRKVAVYFSLLVLYRVAVGIHDSHTLAAIALSCAFLITLGAVATGVLSLLAYLTSRSTVYSITNHRVLLRHGIAVPMTMNVPFNVIEAAELKMFSDNSGDIALRVIASERVGYLITWPHLRPGFVTRPQPSLRALADASAAAQILGQALASDAGVAATRIGSQDHAPAASGLRPRTAAAA
jgi:hypothetical protein